MPSTKDKKSKNKVLKIDVSSDSDSDASEHELSYHAKDKVKLMKEVLKLIKPKKIKSMAPDCIKNLDIVEINSMLLEELLGISNKRLQYIFNGENVDRETSSSESEEEKQAVDVISLDDISDDDDIELCVSQNEKDSLEPELYKKNKKLNSCKIKTEVVGTTVKLEKPDKSRKNTKKKPKKLSEFKPRDADLKETDNDKLMSVLELLELQARARAIRSQLAIETEKKKETESIHNTNIKREDGSDSDAIIIESPQHKEIVITSSDSEAESCGQMSQTRHNPDGLISELSQISNHHPNTESDVVPPQKKQKPHIAQNWDLPNTTKKENKREDVIVNLSNVGKELKSTERIHKENVEADNKEKKEKLLAKIQKIKLVRNKHSTHNKMNTDINNKNQNADKLIDKESNSKTLVETRIVTSETSLKVIEKESQESLLQNIAVSFGIKSDNNDCYELENEGVNDTQTTANEDVKFDDSARKLKKVSPKEMPKLNATYCDNDEIVINLDEDEMDGIEND